MKSTVDKVTITGRGLSEAARTELEKETAAFAQARIDEDAARDEATMAGVAEFERGEFITIEEWSSRINAHVAELKARRST